MEINPSVSGPQDPVPPRPQKHSNTDGSALPAARPRAHAPQLRGLEQRNDADGTQRRWRTLFRSRARETPSPESPNQGPDAQKKDIIRAVDDAVSGQVQPHPVEALTVSLTQIDVALDYLKRSLPPGLADRVDDFGDIAAIEDFLAGSDKLIKALDNTGLIDELMAAVAAELAKADGGSEHADTEESEQRSMMRQMLASPYVRVISLAIVATLLKTAAWYGLPSVSDDTVLATLGMGTLAHPAFRKVVATTAKILGSWLIALTEYIPFTAATTIADKNDIHLARFRGILQPIDLGAFLGAAALLDNETIELHHYLGFAIVIAGSTLANWPDDELSPLDRVLRDATKPDSTMSKALASVREHTPVLRNKDPRDSRSQLRAREAEARALAEYLDADVTAQLESLKTALQSAIASGETAVAGCTDSEPTEQEAALGAHLRKVEKMSAAVRRLSVQLEELAGAAGDQSEQKAKRMKTLFTRAWWIAEGAAATAAAVFMFKDDPMAAAVSLSVGATGVKTLAWYKHTTKKDEELLPEKLRPNDPERLELAYKMARVLYSWRYAFFEYIELTIANGEADVVPVRGAIEGTDAVWTTAFLSMVKGTEIKLKQLSGLLLAAFGIWIATR
jgi:uncharacterized protein (DUF486 family)